MQQMSRSPALKQAHQFSSRSAGGSGSDFRLWQVGNAAIRLRLTEVHRRAESTRYGLSIGMPHSPKLPVRLRPIEVIRQLSALERVWCEAGVAADDLDVILVLVGVNPGCQLAPSFASAEHSFAPEALCLRRPRQGRRGLRHFVLVDPGDITDQFDWLALFQAGRAVDDRMREVVAWNRDADSIFRNAPLHDRHDRHFVAALYSTCHESNSVAPPPRQGLAEPNVSWDFMPT